MTESKAIRAFRMVDPEARSIDPTAFRQKSTNSCWLRPPKRAPAPPPPDCGRPRCDEPAATDNWCAPHAAEEAEWLAVDPAAVTRHRHATLIQPRLHGVTDDRW